MIGVEEYRRGVGRQNILRTFSDFRAVKLEINFLKNQNQVITNFACTTRRGARDAREGRMKRGGNAKRGAILKLKPGRPGSKPVTVWIRVESGNEIKIDNMVNQRERRMKNTFYVHAGEVAGGSYSASLRLPLGVRSPSLGKKLPSPLVALKRI
ncbi:hypothetical protein EVAR_60173_1 [Eumeta japonica]|uniref:Uncharacterized protein n=1 Tax=Eumeta variegata TaxID=151549 RepID=A0A4C1Z5U9_EUMVA|nr:hypothetical protein EVAR_60173_1 [Eumeta japonica]